MVISVVGWLPACFRKSCLKTIFIIERGNGIRDVAGELKNRGLIQSRIGFILYGLATGAADALKPGTYQISSTMPPHAIIRLFTAGSPPVTVVIPEGATVVDIDYMLAAAGVLQKGELIRYNGMRTESLEGMLFPDTYRLSLGMPVERATAVLIDNFAIRMEPLIGELPRHEWYKKLILASLIEKEAAHPDDQILAAGVLTRRLKIGIPLQVDAANVYIKCEGAYTTCPDEQRMLLKKDFAFKSPYNTYLQSGLPPAPIANPGFDAMRAAFNPKEKNYLYYISNPRTGRLIFASTLDEHNEYRKKYLP